MKNGIKMIESILVVGDPFQWVNEKPPINPQKFSYFCILYHQINEERSVFEILTTFIIIA